jgi:hypothetical protein
MSLLDPVTPSVEQKKYPNLFWIVAALSLAIGSLQAWLLPYIPLAEGLGYDGIWYYQPANELIPRTDNYHIFRLLPATIVFFLKKGIYQAHSYHDTVKAFQVYNLICNAISFWLAFRIGRKLRFSGLQLTMFFVFLFFNFHVLKDEIFNPVMTDTTVLLLSLLLLWAYLIRSFWLYIPASLMMLFTFPIGGFILQIIFLMHFSKPEFQGNMVPERWLKTIFFAGTCVFFLVTAWVVYGMGRVTTLTFPDSIHIYLFPLTLSLTSFVIFKILQGHRSLFQNLLHLVIRPKTVFSSLLLVLIFEILIYLFLPSFNQFPAKGFTGNFTISPLIYVTLKPLIGVFDNIMFYGPVMLLFMLNLPQYLKENKNDVAALLLSLCVCIFALKPEARHSVFLLPLLSLVVVKSLHSTFWNRKNVLILGVVCLIFSKFWYPCHLATFPPGYEIFTSKVNHDIFQEFPIQHYFMFQGPMISHANYFLWMVIIVPLAWACYWLNRKFS